MLEALGYKLILKIADNLDGKDLQFNKCFVIKFRTSKIFRKSS